MQAIQLDLFTGQPVMAIKTEETMPEAPNISNTQSYDPWPRGTISSTMTLDPCKGCPLRDLCCNDDCGMKLYEIDDAEYNYYPFEEWLSDSL